jgi:chloramphenicol 3-O phosphotransferase
VHENVSLECDRAAYRAVVIVLLNGTSSAGKTTLATALQRRLPDPLLAVGIDTVVFALPGRWLNPPGWHEVFRYTGEGDSLSITAGPLGDRLVAGLHRMVAGLADLGWDVVVDHVLLDPGWVRDAAAALAPYPLLSVGLHCPLDELIRREATRGDRTLGQARAHFATVHAHVGYDVEVDTSLADPDECATVVADAIAAHRGPSRLTAAVR